MKFILLSETPPDDYILKVPVMVEVVSDYIHTITPVTREIDHLSIPLTEIKFQGRDLSDSAQVKIITRSNPEGYITYLKIKPAIELNSKRSGMQGLGVQKIPVSVRVLGMSSKDSIMVSFSPEKGTVEPGTVFVHSNRPAVVNFRSEGLGYSTLSASSLFNEIGRAHV